MGRARASMRVHAQMRCAQHYTVAVTVVVVVVVVVM